MGSPILLDTPMWTVVPWACRLLLAQNIDQHALSWSCACSLRQEGSGEDTTRQLPHPTENNLADGPQIPTGSSGSDPSALQVAGGGVGVA